MSSGVIPPGFNRGGVSHVPTTSAYSSGTTTFNSSGTPLHSVRLERRLLYEDRVRHTTLGMDLSLRHIHKFVGCNPDHEVYTQVIW